MLKRILILICMLTSAYAADVAITVDTATDIVNRKVLFTNTDNEYAGAFTPSGKINMDDNDITNVQKVAFSDGTVQTAAPATDGDLYYEGGSTKFFESDVPVAALNNNAGHLFISLEDGSEKIMYEASATNMDIALGMIYGKNSGKKFLDLASQNIYGAGGFLNIELDVAYEIRDSAGHDTLRFMDASQALMYDGGTVKAFDLGSTEQINNNAGTKILQLDSDVGLFGENANLILGMSAIHGYQVNDKGGTNFMDLSGRRLTNVVNIGFADGTVQTSASAGGGGFSQSTNFIGCGIKLTSANNNMANGNNVINLGTTSFDSGNLATNEVYGIRIPYDGVWALTYGYRMMDKDGHSRHTQTITKSGGAFTWSVINDGTSSWGPNATINANYVSFNGMIWFTATDTDVDSYINFVINPSETDNELDVDICFFTAIYLGPVD